MSDRVIREVQIGVRVSADAVLPSDWDYDTSVRSVKTLITSFKNISGELLYQLWSARELLSNRGSRPNRDDSQNWTGYLREVGLPNSTVHRWLSQYKPEERRKMTPEEIADQTPERVKADVKVESKVEPKEVVTPLVGDVFDDFQEIVEREEKDEIFRDFDVDGLVDELRVRVASVDDVNRRHEVASAVIKAMREIAAECDRSSALQTRDRSLYHLIEESYEAKNETFDYAAEGAHIKTLEGWALERDDPGEWVKRFLVAAWSLHQDHQLFRDKAFWPRYHVSAKGRPFVFKRMEVEHKLTDADLQESIF